MKERECNQERGRYLVITTPEDPTEPEILTSAQEKPAAGVLPVASRLRQASAVTWRQRPDLAVGALRSLLRPWAQRPGAFAFSINVSVSNSGAGAWRVLCLPS